MATERSTTRQLRLYRAALVLYPRTFRREYREPMVQLFGDCARTSGAKVWLRAIPDLVRTIPSQRIEAVMAHLRPGARIAAIVFIVAGSTAVGIGFGGDFGLVPILAIGLTVLVAAQRGLFTPVFRRERAPLRAALTQTWWAPVAGLLGLTMLVAGVGVMFTGSNWSGRAFGGTLLLAFGLGMFVALMRRPFARESSNAVILITTIPCLLVFWVIVPTVAALAVWIGVLSSGFSDQPVAPVAP